MSSQEELLKPFRIKVDRVMMATAVFLFLITLAIGFIYDGLIFSFAVGLPAVIVPFFIWRLSPGSLLSRLVLASSFVIQIAIQIQLSHGLIELHFGVFVILAFLLAYRDWRPIVFAAGLIAVHHLACNYLQASQFDVWVFRNGADFGLVLIHAAYVVFESVILVYLAVHLREDGIELATFELLAARIAKGDLSSKIDSEQQGGATGMLHSMKIMQDVINNFVSAQSTLAQKHAEGRIHEQIDASQFPGTYGKMARELNELLATHVAVEQQVVAIVAQYAKGDFSADIEPLPGERALVSDAVINIKFALLAINEEIKSLVEAGVKGDFSKRSHANQFDYVFKEILHDIDTLVLTCDHVFEDTARVTKALAEGDLTQTVSRHYPGRFGEVKEGLNTTVANLKNMIGNITVASHTITTAAKEIAVGNNDLSNRTEEQAASLEQTAASMHQLTATVHHNTDNAKHSNELTNSATNIAGNGLKVVGKVMNTMQIIHESSKKIVDIISVMDGIAFQTNILALNASVEAARAGIHGRGFAVVAEEVRNLALRAKTASGEIKGLIDASVNQIELGTRLVNEAGTTMDEIVSSISNVKAIMSEIVSASVEQTMGIEQINQAIRQIDETTQQNAALVEQATAAALSLEDQAHNLSETMAQFKVDFVGDIVADKPIQITHSIPILTENKSTPDKVVKTAYHPSTITPAAENEWIDF